MKVLVTGGTGMVGNAIKRCVKNPEDFHFANSIECDLRDPDATAQLFERVKPDAVIHLAARVGGIKDNSDYLYRYFVDNLRINTNVIDMCQWQGIKKVIALSSTCVYPKVVSEYPIKEEELHKGYPEDTNFGYAFAKRMMQVQMNAFREQYEVSRKKNKGLIGEFDYKWSIVYPSNMYGPYDTFDLQKSHVIPALMLRFHNAVKEGKDFVEVYGTGLPLRQITYVDDVANMLITLLNSDIGGEFNFANPTNYTIATIIQEIVKVTGYWGSVYFNGKLDGVFRKDVDISKISKEFTIPSFTQLGEGLEKTYKWFLENVDNRGVA